MTFGWEKEFDDLRATPPPPSGRIPAHVHAVTTPRRQSAPVPVRPGAPARQVPPPPPPGRRQTGPVQFGTSAYSPDVLPPPEGSSPYGYPQMVQAEARRQVVPVGDGSFREVLGLGNLSLVPTFPRPEDDEVPSQPVVHQAAPGTAAPQPMAAQPPPAPSRRDNVRPLALVPGDHVVRETVPPEKAPGLADILRQAAACAGVLQTLLSQAATMLAPAVAADPPAPDLTLEPATLEAESTDAPSVPPSAALPTA